MGGKKAVVAMSGGVDSSVAAALLVEAGYDVTGIMLKLWKGEEQNNDSGCCNLGAAEDARRVADVLGIPFYVFNFADRFEATVVSDFKATYAAGRTPNPCIRCNQWIKFDALLERATSLGADLLATGHYARVEKSGKGYRLRRGVDPAKDQSYVLWMLTQAELAHCVFPVGGIPKSETRRLAGDLGLRTARKPDSQEICFVRDGDTATYLQENVAQAARSGDIVDTSGMVVGRHEGIGRYTVGQRKGLGIALGVPVFVTSIDAGANRLIVGERADLAVGGMILEEASAVAEEPSGPLAVEIQYRAHGETLPATLETRHGYWRMTLDTPAGGVAPGQSAAFYRGDELLGGGIIRSTMPAAVRV